MVRRWHCELMLLMIMIIPTHSEDCRTWRGEMGWCTDIRQCPEVQQMVHDAQNNRAPTDVIYFLRNSVCEINNGTARVCCMQNANIVGSRESYLLPSECGRTVLADRIVGGVDASLFAWPWMTLLRGRNERGSSWICGGVLISKRYVLTAAHCVHASSRFRLEFVRVGEHTLSSNPDCERRVCAPSPQDIRVEQIIVHEDFGREPGCSRCHDIALLQLSTPAQLNPAHVVPVCLPMDLEEDLNIYNEDLTNSFAWTAGWGTIDPRRTSPSDILQEAFLPLGKRFCDLSSYPDPRMFPNSEEKWKEIATVFEERWHFPHCIGALDGKHIDIIPPANSGSYYYNYKERHSMVLLAIVDAKYKFLLVDFGTNGRISDGGVLQNTSFFDKLVNENLHIPQPDDVSDNFRQVPYVFVVDDAFPLRTNIMKPFRQGLLDSAKKEVFNYRLSRARHIVENVFGILASRFRIFQSPINFDPENIVKVVMGTCALHNFLIDQQSSTYAPVNLRYEESNFDGSVLSNGCNSSQSNMIPLNRRSGNISKDAKEVREQFMNYFMNDDKVPWQNKHIIKNK